jgi:hypothetical protein
MIEFLLKLMGMKITLWAVSRRSTEKVTSTCVVELSSALWGLPMARFQIPYRVIS